MRILKSLVAYDPCNGYTQGMNFIAAALIVHCEESVTFWLCTGLMEMYEIREVYSQEFTGMYKHIHRFTLLLERFLPEIYQKFNECEVLPEMYLIEWILSFMCAYIPLNWLNKYFDEFFNYGWISFYAICLSIHEFLKENILDGEDMPSVLMCMKIMKENRDSMHFQSSNGKENTENVNDNILTECRLSMIQRTKDKDWKCIFDLYNRYIKILLEMNNSH